MTELFVTDRKFFYKLRNGGLYSLNLLDFTTHLKGNNIEEVKGEFDVEISWSSDASSIRFISFSGNSITSSQGSFILDGISVGDTVDVFNGGVLIASDRVVVAMNANRVDIDGAALPSVSMSQDARVRGKNPQEGLVFQFGLIANQNETTNFNSKVDGTIQEFTGDNIGFDTGGGVRDLNPVNLVPSNIIQGWRSGSVTAQYLSNTDIYTQKFRIVHTNFIIVPYYLEGDESTLEAGLLTPFFAGANSLKYVARYEFRNSLTNPNTSKIGIDDIEEGSVGGFNENYDGFITPFTIDSISYEDISAIPLTELSVNDRTKVTVIVDTGSVDTADMSRMYIYHSRAPQQSEYENQTSEFRDVWVYDSIEVEEGFISLGAPISDATVVKTAVDKLTFTFEVEFDSNQKALLTNGGNYIIAIGVEDQSESVNDSKRTSLIADFNQYNKSNDVAGLTFFTDQGFLGHATDQASVLVSQWWTDASAWNEDGFLSQIHFVLEPANRYIIDGLTVRLVAYNPTTGNFFELDRYTYDLNSGVIQDDGIDVVHNLNIDDRRIYNLKDDDQFLQAKLMNLSPAPPTQDYYMYLGFKFRWEDWISLPNADTVFYNGSEPNNGLNYKSSNYSLKNGYEIRQFTDLTLKNFDDNSLQTIYRDISPTLKVLDYDTGELNPPLYSGVIKTFAPDNTDLGGKILEADDTRIEVTWSDSSSPIVNDAIYYGINRIERENSIGQQIYELSTLRLPPLNNWLIPLQGDTLSRKTIVGNDLVIESLIDKNIVDKNLKYKISARIGGTVSPTDPTAKKTETGILKITETNDQKVIEQ